MIDGTFPFRRKLLRDDLFLLYKEHHGFGMKEDKSETDPKQREHHEFWTKRYLILFRSVDFFIFLFFLRTA